MRLYTKPFTVTPYAGVWIEIDKYHEDIVSFQVTPYAGVWIEITKEFVNVADIPVTPYAGVWIEIFLSVFAHQLRFSHSLRGSVD